METSKYLKLSSCGTALMPGTLKICEVRMNQCSLHAEQFRIRQRGREIPNAHGSAINLSVSLIMRFGSAILTNLTPYAANETVPCRI